MDVAPAAVALVSDGEPVPLVTGGTVTTPVPVPVAEASVADGLGVVRDDSASVYELCLV